MELEKKPRIRRNKNFIVEENIDAVHWPRECTRCGGSVDVEDKFTLEKDFKTLGKIHINLSGIPYCRECFPMIQRGKKIGQVRFILALVLGIPIAALMILSAARQPGTTFILCGLLLVIGVLIGYGLSWLIIALPVKLLFKKSVAEPVDAWLIEEQKANGIQGVSVVLEIPYRTYADKFAQLNGVVIEEKKK